MRAKKQKPVKRKLPPLRGVRAASMRRLTPEQHEERMKLNFAWKQLFELQGRIDKLERRSPGLVLSDLKYQSANETLELWEKLTVWFANQLTEPQTTPCGMAERLLRFLGASMTSDQPTDAKLLEDFVITLQRTLEHNCNGTHDDDDAAIYMTIRQCRVVLVELTNKKAVP